MSASDPMRELDPGMINIHDFICSHANEFRQVQFDRGSKVFIEYDCPLKQNSVRVWNFPADRISEIKAILDPASVE